MAAYCEDEHVYLAGLPRGTLQSRARDVASIDVSSNRLEVAGHGCILNTPIQFTIDEGGSFPIELTASTVYYARPVADSDSLIEVSATVDGSAINLTSAGQFLRMYVPIGPTLAFNREFYSRWFDGKAIAHKVPFEAPYPDVAVHAVAIRTAAAVARMIGLGAQSDRLYEAETLLIRDITALVAGIPLRDSRATAASNLARGASPTARRSQEYIPS